jgi:hypothetical protein
MKLLFTYKKKHLLKSKSREYIPHNIGYKGRNAPKGTGYNEQENVILKKEDIVSIFYGHRVNPIMWPSLHPSNTPENFIDVTDQINTYNGDFIIPNGYMADHERSKMFGYGKGPAVYKEVKVVMKSGIEYYLSKWKHIRIV